MTSPIDRLWAEIQNRTTAPTAHQAQVVSVNPLAVAGMDGNALVQKLGSYRPVVGDTVWLLLTHTGPVILDSTSHDAPPSPDGTVTATPAAGATTAAVSVDGSIESLPWLSSYTPQAGQRVRIDWQPTRDGGWSGMILGTSGSVPVPKPPPVREVVESSQYADSSSSGTDTIRAIATGTWRGSGWRSDTAKLVQSTWTTQPPSMGVWFYATLPRGVTVTRARIWLHALTGGPSKATPVRLFLHNQPRRGATRPNLSTEIATPSIADGQRGWWTLPASAVQQLIDGRWHGIAAWSTSRSEYTTLAGLSGEERDPMTGALEITWEKN